MCFASPCFTDKENNPLISKLIAIYILHRDTEGGGEIDRGTDGHGHLDRLSLTHNQCQCQTGNSEPCTVDYSMGVTYFGSNYSWITLEVVRKNNNSLFGVFHTVIVVIILDILPGTPLGFS